MPRKDFISQSHRDDISPWSSHVFSHRILLISQSVHPVMTTCCSFSIPSFRPQGQQAGLQQALKNLKGSQLLGQSVTLAYLPLLKDRMLWLFCKTPSAEHKVSWRWCAGFSLVSAVSRVKVAPLAVMLKQRRIDGMEARTTTQTDNEDELNEKQRDKRERPHWGSGATDPQRKPPSPGSSDWAFCTFWKL